MLKMKHTSLRWILALVLAPMAPFMVLWVANLGREYGEIAGGIIVGMMASDPRMAVIFAAIGPGMFVGMLLQLFLHRSPQAA